MGAKTQRSVEADLLDLDSGDFDISADLETVQLVGLETVSVGSETLAVYVDLNETQ